MQDLSSPSNIRQLWIGAAITSVAAGLFPRLNAVLYEDVPIWELDPEARVLLPIVVAFPLILFATLGTWAWREGSGNNRPARVGLVCGLIAIVGFIAFWLSLPIAWRASPDSRARRKDAVSRARTLRPSQGCDRARRNRDCRWCSCLARS